VHAYTEDRRKVFGRAGAEIMKEGCGGGKRKMGRWERLQVKAETRFHNSGVATS